MVAGGGATGGAAGGAAPTRGGAAGGAKKAVQSGNDIREDFTRRIDELVNSMADAFQEVIRAAPITDRTSDSRAEYQIEVEAANVAQKCEMMLRLVSEIKVACVVQDVGGMLAESDGLCRQLHAVTEDSNSAVSAVATEAAALLRELETHYYASQSLLPVRD